MTVSPHAEFAGPTYAPVDRLIVNAEEFLKENPENHRGHYTLARIHYLAFINKAYYVGVMGQGNPPEVAPDWLLGDVTFHLLREHAQSQLLEQHGYSSFSDIPQEKRSAFWQAVRDKMTELHDVGWQPDRPDTGRLLEHASQAVLSFKKAINRDPTNGLYHLGLASLYRQYLEFARRENIKEHPSALDGVTLQAARKAYFEAYRLSIQEDLKHEHKPISGLTSLVGYEAGKAYVELAQQPPPSEQEARRVNEIQKTLKQLEKLPHGAITPIVFSVRGHTSLDDLLDPGARVSFDLDGDGVAEEWSWVKPTTGILVWDPDAAGIIASGRQLFGTATWWILFPNGYAALQALDDDRDGWLKGPELDGIGTWFDQNCNGRSEPGEVLTARALGVLGINTRPSAEVDGTLTTPNGMLLTGGRTVPTYDWIAAPSTGAAGVPLRADAS
jgi:hypothetical protein